MANMVMLFIYWGILGTALQCLTSCDAETTSAKITSANLHFCQTILEIH